MLSTYEVLSLEELSKNNKVIWYEEMAQYSLRYMLRSSRFSLGSIDNEVLYHLKQLTLLSLYFDKIIIPTSALFNSTDRVIRNITLAVISSTKFEEMTRLGVVKICGWGAKTPYEMINNAQDFIGPLSLNRNNESADYFLKISNILDVSNMVYRTSSGVPDDNEAKIFRSKINTSVFITQEMADKIDKPITKSEKLLGMLTYSAFIGDLEKLNFDEKIHSRILSTYYQSWLKNINMSNTDIYMYVENVDQISIENTISLNGKILYTFLYSPKIFENVLLKYLSQKELNAVQKMSHRTLNSLKNGDWEKFKSAYHNSLEALSGSISNTYIEYSPTQISNEEWSKRVFSEIASGDLYNFDISIFLQSLTGIVGIATQVSGLHHIFNVLASSFGRGKLQAAQSMMDNKKSMPSPFISKLRSQLQYI